MSAPIKNPAKALLRKEIKKILSNLCDKSKNEQTSMVTQKVLDSNAFKTARRIGIYLSLSSEIGTEHILCAGLSQNKEMFVPSYSGEDMVMLKVHSLDDIQTLPLTKWNIRQPTNDGTRESAFENGGLDLILLPGVAFSCDGKRLGHGMGYYDKFLQRYFIENPHRNAMHATNKKTVLIGLAFKEQIVDNIPITDHDAILDDVIIGS